MKIMYSMLCVVLLIVGCKEAPDNSTNELFAKNSETVLKSLLDWENETLDYSVFADNAVAYNTYFGAEKDSVMIQSEETKDSDKAFLAKYDFKLVTNPPVFLPGVNPDTKLPDGSVRYYGAWEVTLPATDSTEAKSGIIKLYESYDFDENGKIVLQQGYGDYSGLMMYLNN
ncbi:hypothetical protein [Thalassobellus suaedae]|uniref:Uncharacterized protein n=1 Tax=Thalassobellus suaedae TaxID=3074124 RepID=A0ABY9Y460_9FLAO|nr:hypothetical protein RHP51_11065 [Flavobacteriaceae bacterium HL-DH14]WNH13033.1 hypothetical protein RHP49_01985 [Flavobacteriaceae bacterium HL-DH10]